LFCAGKTTLDATATEATVQDFVVDRYGPLLARREAIIVTMHGSSIAARPTTIAQQTITIG
jgi:hypothetical protein